MKKTLITLSAVCFLMACAGGKATKQQTADSTAVKTEAQTGKGSSNKDEVVIEGEHYKLDIRKDKAVLTFKGVSYEFVRVEAGTFTMGASADDAEARDDDKPAHKVTITEDYYIGKTEVTWAFWKAVTGNYPPDPEGGKVEHRDNWPVDYASWEECKAFASTLGNNFGELCEFRLPTEAEWEFAARGGNKSKGFAYSGSDNIDEVAWYDDNNESDMHEVGTKKPNELGIYDMSGNADEWCSDMFGKYSSKAQTDPQGPESGDDLYVVRGGRIFSDDSWCRVTARSKENSACSDFYGCRLVFKHYSQDESGEE
jgi:formylglycine-generating enzyme required for sulfatase activity